jgi:uncharacterized protein YggE
MSTWRWSRSVWAEGTQLRRLGGIVGLTAAVAATATVAAAGGAGPQVTPVNATLTASGSGAVTFTPDIASLSFGTSVQKQKAEAAISTNATAMTKLIDALKAAGARDLATNSVSLSIVYSNSQPATLTGFQASNSVQASAPVDEVGSLIDTAVAAGATSISGPSFSSSGDVESRYRTALRAAIVQARQRAQVLADAGGVRLVRIVSITPDSGSGVTARPVSTSASTPVLSPTQQVSASATLVFAVEPAPTP